MDTEKERAIKEAFAERVEKKPGNKITITCKTRSDALLVAKWNGIQNSGTYTQNPLPDCFTELTWNNTGFFCDCFRLAEQLLQSKNWTIL